LRILKLALQDSFISDPFSLRKSQGVE